MGLTLGEAIGFLAGALVTGAFVPQVVRLYRMKSAREISLAFTLLSMLGGIAWLSYGLIFHLVPIVFWNVIFLSLIIAIFVAKLRYGRADKA